MGDVIGKADSMPDATPDPVTRIPMPGRLNHDMLDEILFHASDLSGSDLSLTSGDYAWIEHHGWHHRMTTRTLTGPEVSTALNAMYDGGPGEIKAGRDLDFSYEVRRRARDGGGEERVRFRVNATGGRFEKASGIQLTFRILEGVPRDFAQLEVEPEIAREFHAQRGLVLVTGPTGSGKTSTLGGAVRYLCEDPGMSLKVVEYSAPIELVYDDLRFPHSFVHQCELDMHLRPRDLLPGETIWGYCARNALRRKIGLVILGEARDRSAISGCVRLTMAGHSVISTLHTLGVAESIRRVLLEFPLAEQQGIAADLIECLNLIVSQLLIPRLGGGRVAIREYGVFTPRVKRILMQTPIETWGQRIRELMVDGTMPGRTLSQHADRLYENGVIAADQHQYVVFRERGAAEDTLADLASAPRPPGSDAADGDPMTWRKAMETTP